MNPARNRLRPGFLRFASLHSACMLILPAVLQANTLRFEKEKITIVVSDSVVRLTGDYYFRNPAPDTCRTEIFYPFVILPGQPFPDFMHVSDASDDRTIEHEIRADGIRFRLVVDPFKMIVVRVEYRQSVRSRRFEYLLTTTASWGAALRLAEYRIILPPNCKIMFCSLPFAEIKKENGRILYLIRRENFLPGENLIVQWGRDHDR